MSRTALDSWLGQRVRDVMDPVPAVAAADDAPGSLLARLVAATGGPAIVVVDGAGRALGLVEAEQLLPHLGTAGAATRPAAADLADRGVLLAADQPVLDAIARMRGLGRERALVADPEGRPIGLLRLAPAIAAGFGSLLPALERALGVEDGQPTDPALAKRAQLPLVEAMLADGRSARDVQAALGVLNDRLVARVVADAVRGLAADGWGEPPVPFTMIQMGSAGRRESFLGPDQDHGLILADYPADRHGAIDPWFIALAERLARDLARAGYPLCDGNVMAINPLWRKSLAEWRDQVLYWTRSRSNQAILQADIFFDFRAVYGPPEPAAALRDHVTVVVRDARPFLAQMCWRQREQGNPLGLFGHLGQEPIDLKLWGTLPLVELTRIMALGHGIPHPGTLARLDALAAAGAVPRDLHEVLVEDHDVLADLRLRRQLEDLRAGRGPGNLVEPRALSDPRRQRLERLFHDLERFRRRVLSELLGTAA